MKKKEKRDFFVSDLPNTRTKLFIDILKNQWNILIVCSIYFLLAFLPFILYRYHHLITISNLLSSNQTREEMISSISQATFLYLLVSCFLFLWIGIFLAGLMRIYKRLSFQEGVFVGADFIQGVKENGKDFLFIVLFYDVLYFLVEYIAVSYMASNQLVYYLMKVIHYFLLLPLLFLSLYTSAMYQDKLIKKIYTSVIVYIRFLPKNLLFFTILLLPNVCLLFAKTSIQIFVPILYVISYLPIGFVLLTVMINGFYDQLINQYHFKDLVNKGLYKN